LSSEAAVTVVVSIVTWRAPQLTINCLASLETEMRAHESFRVIVVDNNSEDGTAEAIEATIQQRNWSAWVQLVRAPSNGGFASGNNIVARLAAQKFPRYRYLMLVNPDTELRSGAVHALRVFMDATPEAGIAGGSCEDPDGAPQGSCFRFPGITNEFVIRFRLGLLDRLLHRQRLCLGDFDSPTQVGWVVGALMMIRREVFDSIGLMDEGYFLYYEETDFSYRAQQAGWSTWHVPESRAVHHSGQLTGVQPNELNPKRLPQYWFDSRRRYFVLNYGLAYARAVDVSAVLGTLLYQVRRLVERKPSRDPKYWVRDVVSKGALGRGWKGMQERQTT
jgi:N-acetylglucosaminyl-diphospho-decaprenol L-rhamnosyltransferase